MEKLFRRPSHLGRNRKRHHVYVNLKYSRTRAELSFFVSSTQIENKFPVYFRTQCRRERRSVNDFEHRHYDVLTRILFIYAKLNPAIRYVV